MARGLDHIVHAVRDLDAAAEFYRRLGFTVGARNRHPWGTHNHIVQLPGFFIEVLTMAEPDKLGDDGFSRLFGAFNRDFLMEREGFSLLILESANAENDEREFRAASIAQSPVMRFEREGKRPDGSAVKVAFSLAFAENRHAPDIHFCVCQQHYPENFWNPKFQTHDNGAKAVTGVVMVAGSPVEHSKFLKAYTGVTELDTAGTTVTARLPRGQLAIMEREAFKASYGVDAPVMAHGARLAVLRMKVTDIDATRALLKSNGVVFSNRGPSIIIAPSQAMGAAVIFE